MKKNTLRLLLVPGLILSLFNISCIEQSSQERDWLIHSEGYEAQVVKNSEKNEITLTNGLIQRTFRTVPNCATVAFENLMTGETIIRGVKPEAVLEINGVRYEVGGLEGQEEYAYLRPEWADSLTGSPESFQFESFSTGKTRERFPWRRKRYSENRPWPPPGVSLTIHYQPPEKKLQGLLVSVHYEMYDNIPLISKWFTITNQGKRTFRLNTFISEILAVVEAEVTVEPNKQWTAPNIHIESDYAFHGMTPKSADKTAYWVPDPQYTSQVNYQRLTPCMLECRPPLGPDIQIAPEETLESFRTFELIHDSTDRERKGLALRRMYRTISPWVTENPIFMHLKSIDPEVIRQAIDQCVEVGFEMVIISFGSGLNMENQDPDYIEQFKKLVDYAHSKGIELGGYSLLASRRISDEHDVIHPRTGKPGGAIFGNSPCLGSRWGEEYIEKLYNFFKKTGFDLLEHDGSYPGDVCASTKHPGHEGLNDSQWTQLRKITDFYKWCRSQGIYLNVPDWYFLSGSSKTGMGYRETNWSLPRERQIILARQNIYDGTWEKTPSMGWMFVPLVEYHGGGEAATLEPLSEHLDAYRAHLALNFGAGVQACYRGTRLYDTEETKALVKEWVDFYKKYRDILNSDIIHVRRPDGRDIDCILHVNPGLKEKGLAMVYNPLLKRVKKTLTLPLYYTGLTKRAKIREREGRSDTFILDRNYRVQIQVDIPAKELTWFVIE